MDKQLTPPSPADFVRADRLRHTAETVRDPQLAGALRRQALGALQPK